MAIYYLDEEDARGDLVAIHPYCGQACAPNEASPWPGGRETDYPQFCEGCGDPVGNPLTGDGRLYLEEMIDLLKAHENHADVLALRNAYQLAVRP